MLNLSLRHLIGALLCAFVHVVAFAQNDQHEIERSLGKHTCGHHANYVPPESPDPEQYRTVLTNLRAYTQSIHNVIAKWDAGTIYNFSYGTAPNTNNIYAGHALWATDTYTPGHSFAELQNYASGQGTTFNIGDFFYLNLYSAPAVLDTAIQLQFLWEDLGTATNNITIQVELNYGKGGAPAYTPAQAAKLMAFYDLVNPIIKQVYGPPASDQTVYIVNDAYAQGVNIYYNGPDQISSNATNYVDANNDLNQPRLMIHELVHAYRNNVILSSNAEWHYDPHLSGFEEGMAESVAIIVMDIFADTYPNFFNGSRHKIHWNHARGMPFEWDYDFQNHQQLTTEDYFSSDVATGSHWVRYGTGATALKKMYIEDPDVFRNFNAEYYSRLNADHTLLPSRALVVDILETVKPEVERTPMSAWVDEQRILDCTLDIRKKVFMLSFTALSWARFQHDNRIHFIETHQNGLDWRWDSTDPLGTNEVEDAYPAGYAWTHQLNNTPGDIDFIRDWDNTSYRFRGINNNNHWLTDAGGPYAGQSILGPYQGPNPFFIGANFTRDEEQDDCALVPGCGKRAWAIGNQNLYTSTSTVAGMWPLLVSQGGTLLDARAETSMNESGLYRFKIGFNDSQGPRVEDSYFRLLGDAFIDPIGVFGGIYSDLTDQVGGRMIIEHEDFGIEPYININNNSYIAPRTWASILETDPKFQGGRNDMEYSVPGTVHAIYMDATCAQMKIDFRTIGYGDGLEGTQMLLFNVEAMDDIIYTQSNDVIVPVGATVNLDITNNFPDILDGDPRINFNWLDPNNNSISTDPAYTLNNVDVGDEGTYTIEVGFMGCPTFSLPVQVDVINPLPIELLEFNATLEDNRRVRLDWTTGSENDNDYFTIERSTDVLAWSEVGTVDGAGNSNSAISYNTYDEDPLHGLSYYRLTQTDFGGDRSHSDIRPIMLGRNADFEIYPNPAQHEFTVALSNAKEARISILNALGQEITLKTTASTLGLVFDASDLPHGVYLVQVLLGSEVRSKKLIVN